MSTPADITALRQHDMHDLAFLNITIGAVIQALLHLAARKLYLLDAARLPLLLHLTPGCAPCAGNDLRGLLNCQAVHKSGVLPKAEHQAHL